MNSRKIALEILLEIEKNAYSNIILNKYLPRIKKQEDKALITEIVYGVLRYRNRLDYIIKKYSKIPLEKMDKEVLLALRLAIYQIEFLEKIPARAAVNETVNASKAFSNKGAVGFVNGLLRNFLRNRDKLSYPDSMKNSKDYMINYLSHPEWLVDYWLQEYKEEKLIELLKNNNKAAELHIRVNTIKYSVDELRSVFKRNNLILEETIVADNFIVKNHRGVKSLPLYEEGGFIVQGTAASLSSHILNPRPGMKVLDMTAAPGGKTTHLAALMQNKGELRAFDIYPHKIQLIEDNCHRLGVEIVKTSLIDARNYQSSEEYDMILLDAPCTGLGLIQQKPEIRWNKSKKDIENLARLQLELLHNAIKLLKKEGILLYSTCTLSREENRENIYKIVNESKADIEIYDIYDDLKRLKIDDKLSLTKDGFLELFPPETGTEGFFMAKLKKIRKDF
ncbi:MAG: 16S rRNA (cytosine(967)-C(5))-methyltransferase RsmB [Halanaerobiaceae bacterium]